MKKIFYLMALLPMLFACTEESSEGDIVIVKPETLPSTKVFVQGTFVDFTSTRSDYDPNKDYGYGVGNYPCVDPAGVWEVAKFSIRIDGTNPGVDDQDQGLYWTERGGANLGKVYVDYPWGTYDCKGRDYYKVDQVTGKNKGMFRYVLDPSGVQVEKALMEIPDMKPYLEWCSTQSKTKNKALLKDRLENWEDYKIVWYLVKEVSGIHFWHVNGILIEKDKTPEEVFEQIEEEIEEDGLEIVPGKDTDDVEIDIHKQEHKDWYEIKTSVHIRTDAEYVQINIPIDYSNIIEQDDFAIRVYNYYFTDYEITNLVYHNEKGITITIRDIDPELIQSLKDRFGDGLTVEIHSYCKKEDGVWEAMKQTTVETGKECNLKYQITSADPTENETMISYEYTVPVPEETGE